VTFFRTPRTKWSGRLGACFYLVPDGRGMDSLRIPSLCQSATRITCEVQSTQHVRVQCAALYFGAYHTVHSAEMVLLRILLRQVSAKRFVSRRQWDPLKWWTYSAQVNGSHGDRKSQAVRGRDRRPEFSLPTNADLPAAFTILHGIVIPSL
jgi:hypothetical protein